MYYLYQITNKINGKIYIGCHKTTNLEDDYMGSGKHLKRAINKYGVENFEKIILKQFETEEEMFQEEVEIVNEEFVNRKDTYNIKIGGNGGWSYVNKNINIEEMKLRSKKGHKKLEEKYGNDWARIAAKKGHKKLEEKYGLDWKKILNEKCYKAIKELYPEGTFKNKKHTEESKRKIGEKNSIHQSGKKNSQYGTMWITNGIENKKIKKDEQLPKGWYKGRKI